MIVDSFAACFDFSLYIGIIKTSSVEIPVQCGGHVTLLRVFGPRGNTVDGSCLYISLHLNLFLCGSTCSLDGFGCLGVLLWFRAKMALSLQLIGK